MPCTDSSPPLIQIDFSLIETDDAWYLYSELEQQATAKPCFYDDICRSGKSLIVVGGKGRPATVVKLSLATNNLDKSYCEVIPKQKELHSCGTVVLGSEVFVVGGCSESYPVGYGVISRIPKIAK